MTDDAAGVYGVDRAALKAQAQLLGPAPDAADYGSARGWSVVERALFDLRDGFTGSRLTLSGDGTFSVVAFSALEESGEVVLKGEWRAHGIFVALQPATATRRPAEGRWDAVWPVLGDAMILPDCVRGDKRVIVLRRMG